MCLALPALVTAVVGQSAAIELDGGTPQMVDGTLCPDLRVGQYVLVDRGMAIRVIDADEAAAIREIYAQIGQLLADADAASGVDEGTDQADGDVALAPYTRAS